MNSWVGFGSDLAVSAHSASGSQIDLQTVNSAPGKNGLALFNAYWGTEVSLGLEGCYARFAPNGSDPEAAYQFSCGTLNDIPLKIGEFVLVGRGAAATWLAENSASAISFSTAFPLAAIDFMVGGSHVLIQNAAVTQLDSPPSGSRPRTAIGIDTEGFVYLVVVDGDSDLSAGMTLVELQQYLNSLGLVNAINLDGGGSSTIVVQNTVQNFPSEGGVERVVAAVVEITRSREICLHPFIRC